MKIHDVSRRVFELTSFGAIGVCVPMSELLALGFSKNAISLAQDEKELVLLQHPGPSRRLEVYPTANLCREIRKEEFNASVRRA